MELSPFVLGFVARFDREGGRGELAPLLEERGFAAHAAVRAFDERYGGHRVFESDADPPALVIGAYACLSVSPYDKHERDLVPVIFGADDTIYALDGRGRGWVCAAMVEGVSRPCARDGRQLLSQAILWRALGRRNFVTRKGAHGAELAAACGAPALDDLTSDHEAWWGNDGHLVVEIPYGNGFTGPMTYACESR